MESEKALERLLRIMRMRIIPDSTPHRSGHNKQLVGKHPDTVQVLPQFLAQHGETGWEISGWEDAVPRVSHSLSGRVDRLKGLGNAIVPQVAAEIFNVIKQVDEIYKK